MNQPETVHVVSTCVPGQKWCTSWVSLIQESDMLQVQTFLDSDVMPQVENSTPMTGYNENTAQ